LQTGLAGSARNKKPHRIDSRPKRLGQSRAELYIYGSI
jgi:hypothetical protein